MRSFASERKNLSTFIKMWAYWCSWSCGLNHCWSPPICWRCCWMNWRIASRSDWLKRTCRQPNFPPKLSWKMTWLSHGIDLPGWPSRGYYCFDDGECRFSPSESIHWPLKREEKFAFSDWEIRYIILELPSVCMSVCQLNKMKKPTERREILLCFSIFYRQHYHIYRHMASRLKVFRQHTKNLKIFPHVMFPKLGGHFIKYKKSWREFISRAKNVSVKVSKVTKSVTKNFIWQINNASRELLGWSMKLSSSKK